jgi:hypothetical protein
LSAERRKRVSALHLGRTSPSSSLLGSLDALTFDGANERGQDAAQLMTDLSTIVLSAVLSTVKGPASNDTARLTSIARDITTVVAAREAEVFAGDGGDVALAMMLVALAKHESEFLASVDSCARRGDAGRSITLFQILRGPNWAGHTADEICGNRKLAVKLTIRLLARPLASRAKLTPQMIVNAYATGSPGRENTASKDICLGWERLAQKAGLTGAVCGAFRSYAAPAGLTPAASGARAGLHPDRPTSGTAQTSPPNPAP